ncbi:MAG: glycoside hydrolase family 3 C-terminal domain-containing protein [Muribaculaceae bacterium]|nr:glycoside hydrolase family 3 C-terminal domain-containing protein [Muribaculaceae bacterium]
MKLRNLVSVMALCCSPYIWAQQLTLTPDNIDEIVSAMTPDEKVHLVIGCGMQYSDDAKFPGTAGLTYAIPRLGITSVYLADGPHRFSLAANRPYDSHVYNTTEVPSGATLASTFDQDAAFAIGELIGQEVSDYGMDVLLAPGVNLMRNPLCGRNHEYYSEDPVVAGKIAAGYINGLQSKGTGACIKHFAVNNQETNRNKNDSRIDQRTLRELYLKQFEIAIKESNPWSVMTSYNKINGEYTCEDVDLTENILRGEWGYGGMVMSDWAAGQDGVLSMIAGNDMLQPGSEKQFQDIKAALEDGRLDPAILDRNVRRILEFVVKSHTYNNHQYPNDTDLKAHAAAVRKIGAEGIVLLENNGVLPLNKGVDNVGLYGVTSYDMIPAGMGFGATGRGYYTVSMVEGLRNAGIVPDPDLVKQHTSHIAAEQKRLYPEGLPSFSLTPPLRPGELIPSAAELEAQAKSNDAAVITLGRTSGEGADRRREEFYLKDNEKELLEAVSHAYRKEGKPVIVVLNICSPVETSSWSKYADALVCAFQPGQEVGNSIVDVLTGKVNPSGRLPMTFEVNYGDAIADAHFPADYEFQTPDFAMGTNANFENKNKQQKPKEPEANVDYTEYPEGVFMGYRDFDTNGKAVAYPFGYGGSYTSFDMDIEEAVIDGDRCVMKVKVTNTGSVPGREVVQGYVSAPKGKLPKPAKELKAFGKTSILQPQQSETITLTWPLMEMSSYNEKAGEWQLDKGVYSWHAAASSADIRDSRSVKVEKARRQNAPARL